MKKFLLGVREGVTTAAYLAPIIPSTWGVAFVPTILIGHLTGNLGLFYKTKIEQLASIKFLWLTHLTITVTLLGVVLLYVYLFVRKSTKKEV